jgi:predicted kinase
MNNQKLFILCGEAFSGKSTLSKLISEKYNAKIIGRDEIYFSIEKILALENTPEKDDDSLWKNMWPLVLQGVKNQLLLGNSVIIDDNCFYKNHRDQLRAIASESGVKSVLIYMDIPTEILKERKEQNKISKTRHDVPSEWTTEDSNKFERPTDDENPIVYTQENTTDEIFKKIDSI